MTVIIRHIRTLLLNESQRKKSRKETRRKSLTVTISKEPPVVVYYEPDVLEGTFECIFDPKVSHDTEKDHPDLFKQQKKPWQKYPYRSQSTTSTSFKNMLKSFHINTSIFVHSHQNDTTPCKYY